MVPELEMKAGAFFLHPEEAHRFLLWKEQLGAGALSAHKGEGHGQVEWLAPVSEPLWRVTGRWPPPRNRRMLAGGLQPVEESAGHWKELALCGVVSHISTHP